MILENVWVNGTETLSVVGERAEGRLELELKRNSFGAVQDRSGYPSGALETSLKYLEASDRKAFFGIFLTLFVIAVFGNVSAIFVTIRRKHRCIQKTFIISLCMTDLIMATAYATNNLETYSHPLVNWTLGTFMCGFIPTAQIFGVIGSSMALVGIALDRYHCVVHATKQRWNPAVWKCLAGITVMWLIWGGISYPIFNMFEHRSLFVLFLNPDGSLLRVQLMYVCLSFQKESLKTYYICMAITVFLPIVVIFMWLYFHIARLVWTHRKPFSHRYQKKENNSDDSSTGKSIESNNNLPAPKNPQPKVVGVQHSVHVERKIRTFKIIVLLMLIFFLCRIPYWVFYIMRLVNVYTERRHWIITGSFNLLNLLNCALNPFLYAFLNTTVSVVTKIHRALKDFVCKVCCCCITNTEFEEFEKENPFMVESRDKKSMHKTKSQGANVTMKRSSRVKFEDVDMVKTYSQETNTNSSQPTCKEVIKKY